MTVREWCRRPLKSVSRQKLIEPCASATVFNDLTDDGHHARVNDAFVGSDQCETIDSRGRRDGSIDWVFKGIAKCGDFGGNFDR